MLVPYVYILAIWSFVVRSQHIFSGMDDLDQVLVDDISPGGDVDYSESPYIAAVFNSLVKYQTCTGFIIHRYYVLAAGYCVTLGYDIVDPMFVTILAGVYDFRDRDMDQWRYAVSIKKLSHTYKDRSVLVLIRVSEAFFLNFSCDTIEHRREKFTKNSLCTAMSWRFYDKLNRLTLKSLVLKKNRGYVMNKTNCMAVFRSNPVLSGLMHLEFVCMSFLTKSHDFDCMAADGSSLICDDGEVVYAAGIATSYYGMSKCNRFDVPNVFLDLGSYSRWIDNEMIVDDV